MSLRVYLEEIYKTSVDEHDPIRKRNKLVKAILDTAESAARAGRRSFLFPYTKEDYSDQEVASAIVYLVREGLIVSLVEFAEKFQLDVHW